MRVFASRRSRLAVGAAVVLLLGTAVPLAIAFTGDDADDAGEQAPARAAGLNPHPVAGHFRANETELADCTPERPRCYEQAFGNIAFSQGPKRALALFDARIQSDTTVEANCHRIAHTIGSAALARLRGDVGEAFVQGSSSCWSGYYHGILERAFTGVSSTEQLAEASRRLCEDSDIRRTSFLAYQCVHGLGHGLMIYSGYNLPFSLSICDRLSTGWDQTSCTGGVFMENISSTYGVRSKWLRDDDPVYPCQAVKKRHKLYCYLMVTSRISQLNGYDWKQTAAVCRGVERGWNDTCFQSYGRDASGFTRQNPSAAARICLLAKAWASSCFYGAARDMTSNYANGRRAARFCLLAPRLERRRCFYGIGTILGTLFADAKARRAACAEIAPRRLFPACFEGTGSRAKAVVQTPA